MTLRDELKENQILTGNLISEDMLIRSSGEAQKNIVPFILQMGTMQNL